MPASRESGALPSRIAAWLASAPDVLAGAATARDWDARTRSAALAAFDRVTNLLTVARARVVTAERDAGTWALRGDRDLAGFLGRVSHQGLGAGRAAVGEATTLESMPIVALVDGPVTAKHVAQITRATQESPALNVSHAPGGTQISALLDSVAGHQFVKAIDALNPRPTKDDDRTATQRRADALMAMVQRTVTDKSTTPGAVAPVQAVITFTQETWAALRAARGGARDHAGHASAARDENGAPSKGSTADVIGAVSGVPAVTDEDGQAWPAGEIARALCDCALTRAVLKGPGLPLDLGRGDRYFRTQHWLALYASGQTTCAWPGCSMPLRYSELHHMRWWDRDDGPSTMANCAPECRFHHQYIHDHDISVTRLPDGTYEHRDRHGRLIGDATSPPAEASPIDATAAASPGARQSAVPQSVTPARATTSRVASTSVGPAARTPSLWLAPSTATSVTSEPP